MRHVPALALATVLIAGGSVACGDASADDTTVVAPLCDAMAAPDGTAAGEVFTSRVHRPLHELADEVTAVDRTVATGLLEAKSAVETVVEGDTEVPDALVRQRLEDLAEQVRAALDALDRPAPDC